MIREGIGVLLVLAVTAALAVRDGPDEYGWRQFRRAQAIAWLLAAGVVAYALLVEGEPLSSLNYPPVTPLVDAVLTSWLLVGGAGVGVGLLFRVAGWAEFGDAERALFGLPAHRALALSVSAGVTEEVVFRGYLVTRVVAVTGSELAAVAVSAAAFTGLHASSRSRNQLAQLAVVGVAFASAFATTGSLLAVVFVHASYDAVSLATTDPEDLEAAGD